MATLSTLAAFDDIRRCQAVLTDGTAEEEFLKFARFQEEVRLQWLSAIQEAQRLQRELDSSLQNMADLEAKLFHARRLLEMENKARREAEHERDQMEKKIVAVADLLKNERDIKEETKDKLAFLNSYPKKRKSVITHGDEKLGNEINSTGSFLSDLSLTQSEDDFLDMKTSKTWKKHRPSYSKNTGTFVGGKRSRISTDGRKNRSSSKFLEIGPSDKIVAQTKLTIPQNDGPIHAESIIQAIPPSENKENESNNNKIRSPQRKSPKKYSFTPSAPPLQEFHTKNTPTYEFKRSVMRAHNFSSKTFLKSDVCTHCQKKIRFGSVGCKCRDCRVCVHPDCRELLTVTCVPQSAGTPTMKGAMGLVGDYAPSIPPMIPALIVHCVHEIETRGLSEVGIYRISGAEREVKALKERFLRGKGTPHISNTDIHVLCGCIKDFLRSLREPLIPTNLWKDFSNAVQNMTEDSKKADLYQAIGKLPQPNRDTLSFLIMHFQRIAECSEIKMPIQNIARVFGPTIVGYSSLDPDQHAIFMETMIQFSVMESLMNIPTDYWSQFVNLDFEHQQEAYRSDETVSKAAYGTPLKGTMRKERKFYATPPYPYRKKTFRGTQVCFLRNSYTTRISVQKILGCLGAFESYKCEDLLIENCAPSSPPKIPALLVFCVTEIESRGLFDKNLYRFCGLENEAKELKKLFLKGVHIKNITNIDVHILCKCIIVFLYSLSEPLIPLKFWNVNSTVVQSMTDSAKAELYEVISTLPRPNRDSLAFLMLHFQRLIECIELDIRMEDIAEIFGPTIIGHWNHSLYEDFYSDLALSSSVLGSLINLPTAYWLQFVSFDSFNRKENEE